MAAGLGFKEFTTGDVLTAADANGYLASQVVMVFADSAARTTAITSPQEGMISYLKDTNAVEKYDGAAWVAVGGSASPLTTKGDLYTFSTVDARLGVGADGTTLVADSGETTGLKWVTPASGGGLVFIDSQTFSAVASHSMNNIFTATYANYRIILDFNGTGDWLYVRLRASGSDKTTANYQSSIQNSNKSVAGVSHDENGTQWARLALIGKTNGSISFDVIGPQATQNTLISQQGGFFKTTATTDIGTQYGAGLFKVTDSVDGITFFGDSGNITGKVQVYGYANS